MIFPMRPIFMPAGLFFLTLFSLMPAVAPAYASSVAGCDKEVERGVASWYGPGFEGALTKNEEIFNPNGLSAAHPALPFGTVVKVTNMKNARSIAVRINDRGAFGGERVIDLSEGAARRIGMIEDGLAPVAIFMCE